jgi:hypothetical protein
MEMTELTVKDYALKQLSDAKQLDALEALTALEGLEDDHPIWATVAMLGAVINRADISASDTANEVSSLRDEVLELKGLIIGSMGYRDAPGGESVLMLAKIRELMSQILEVLSGSANLNKQMPGFLQRLEGVLGDTQRTLSSLDAKMNQVLAKE